MNNSKTVYGASLDLSKLHGVIREEKAKSGMIKTLVLPIDKNLIEVNEDKKGNIHLNIRCNIVVNQEADKYGQSGFISQQAPRNIYASATEAQKEEFKNLPILGNLFKYEKDGESATTKKVDEGDDLPF